MKMNTRRFLSVILCLLMALSAIGSFTLGVSAEAATIYVSESGDDANAGTGLDKPVKTLANATKLAGEGGTVIVMDSVDVGTGDKILGCTIKGLNPSAVINLTGWCMRFSGPVTLENVTVNAKVAWSYILAQGYKFVVGEGVTVTADPGVTTALSIRGGGDGLEIGGSCELVVKSGAWKTIVGGTRNKDTKGNTHVTIYDTAIVQNVNIGNENAKDVQSTVVGSGTVKLVGKSNPIPGAISGSVGSNRYIDITEYDGVIPDSWYNSGMTFLADSGKVPADAKPISEGGVVGVPGKTYDTGAVEGPKLSDVKIYLSDNGNDSNDGKTIGTAVKTMAKACTLAGAGGTVVIADKHTYVGENIKAARIEGFTDDCVMDVTVWRVAIGANCEFDHFTLNTSYNWSFVLCGGFKFTAGENLTVTKKAPATVGISIRGGGEKMNVTGNTNIVLKGGEWHNVYAGTKAGFVSGNTNVTVYAGVPISNLMFGNDTPGETDTISGRSVLKLMGNSTDIKAIKTSDLPRGGCFVDISEYDGQLPEDWDMTGISIITEKGVEAPVIKEPEIEIPTSGTITEISAGSNVIYISDNGSDAYDGKTPDKAVKTLPRAITVGGKNATVVVVDTLTAPGAVPACTLTGYSSESTFKIPAWCFRLSGDVKFENITLVSLVKYSYILAMGKSLTIGENVKVVKGPDVTTELGIRGGGDGQALNSNSNIVIMSGNFGDVHGGTRNESINGHTFVTIHEGAKVKSVNIGNNGIKEGQTFNGNGVIKLVGAPSGFVISGKPEYQTGEMILDLTEYTGAYDDSWSDTGATVILDKEKLPEYVKAHFETGDNGYDLSGITKFRYISDNGNDSNDGLTAKTPMKSIKAAVNAMGEGGTVIVTGTYTLSEYTSGLPSFNITSARSTDKFVMGVWALHTNNTHIYNLNISVPKSYYFILHQGKPLHIGKNVAVELTDGATVYPGIRGNESGDVAMTDITIESGDWATIFTGTKKGNILGHSTVTLLGGKASIIIGNDSEEGRTLGSTRIILKDKPSVNAITDKRTCDGYTLIDISEFTGVMPGLPLTATVVRDKDAGFIPTNKTALFINGYPDGTFLPEKVMTRAEAITVAAKVAGMTSVYKGPDTTAFTDLKAEDWYSANVKYLESFGALEFWGSTLDAGKGITRGEFVKLISGMINKAMGEAVSFSDVNASHPFYNEIILSAKAGLVTGYPDGTFLPDNTLKRSEIVTILNRLTERNIVNSNAANVKKFSDIDGHWAAPQIIAASCASETDGILVWYMGEKFASNSPIDPSKIELTTTKAVLEGVDVSNSNAVAAAVEAYAVKRRAEIASTPTAVNVTGTKYYVSEKGNDSADGKAPETAWKSIDRVNKAQLYEGDGVFFMRGEVFRGKLVSQKGVTYSAYGDNAKAKPQIIGSAKNYSGCGFWVATNKPNIYVSTEAFPLDVGLIVFDDGKEVGLKEILNIKGFMGALTKDLQFFHDKNDNKIYLYSVSDPNTRWASTEIAPGTHGISGNGNGVTIDNLCVKYFGAHGIGYGDKTTGLTVQNCEIGWIGGMLQNTDRVVRYGNGVEIYVGCKDYTITNCHIYQVYDAGITHQYFQTKSDRVDMENIKYTDNVIEYCTYDIEYVNAQPADRGVMRNVEISGNLLLHGAEGWGVQRSDSTPAVIKGWSNINNAENAVYSDNVLMTTANNCVLLHLGVEKYSYMPELYGNLLVAKRGSKLGFYGLMTENIWHVYDEKITDTTMGLDDNTMIFLD